MELKGKFEYFSICECKRRLAKKTIDFIGNYLIVSTSKDKIVNKGTENRKPFSAKC